MILDDDRRRAAEAVRRLGNAVAGRVLEPELLDRIAAVLEPLSVEAETARVRDKSTDMSGNERWEHFRLTGRMPEPPGDGEIIHFDPGSLVGGVYNPFGMGASHHREGDEAVTRLTLTAPFEGPPARVHGGVVAAIVDEAMAALMPTLQTVAFTGELRIRLVAGAPMGVPVEFRARLLDRQGRKLIVGCTGSGDDGVFVEAEATFIEFDPARFAGLTGGGA